MSSMRVLSYYDVTRPRKIKVRVVKAHAHVPYLGSENVIDIRAIVNNQKSKFGSTFFLTANEKKLTEYEAWQKLGKKLKRRVI